MKPIKKILALLALCLLPLAACGPQQDGGPVVDEDRVLAEQVRAALLGASDLPQGLAVEVADGVVLVSGVIACEDCGGNRTPGNVGTIQQSLGTVVRAVPGVTEVRFELDYEGG